MGPVTAPRPTEQTLAGMPRVRAPRTAAELVPAGSRPVARVCVDVQPAHLDRVFEYLVPAALDETAVPGARVKVRFAGQEVAGWLLDRVDRPEHDGRLSLLRRVVGAEPMLTPEVARLARAVADRYAGTLSDVLRLAVPARHARVEAEPDPEPDGPARSVAPIATAWTRHRGGAAFLQRLTAGESPRAVWTALPGGPGARWPDAIAQAVAACVLGGRGAVVVVPDVRDVERVLDALGTAGIPAWRAGTAGGVVRLTAADGPAARYRAFLAARRGRARVVVGTRASAFAPVADLGLVVCWEDGDPLHAEPRAPYPHAREVLTLRAELTGAAVLVGGLGRSVEAQHLLATGWAREVAADRAAVRAATARVRALTSVELAREGPAGAARLPAPVFAAVRAGLADGPVLVQVPRAGYVPVVACDRCRAVARCAACTGPLAVGASGKLPACRWCGRLASDWRCPACGNATLRSVRVGSQRTAEEVGRAFPGVTVRLSGARADGGVLATVPDVPAVVVATPGAEPVAERGYTVGVLLDAAVGLGSGLSAETTALRHWLTAAALVRPTEAGGQVLLVGDGPERPTQALVRWDPAGLAARELDERAALRLPPTAAMAEVSGERAAVALLVGRVQVPDLTARGLEVLGPVPLPQGEELRLEPDVRTLLRVPRGAAAELARALSASSAVRSARREGGSLRVRVDPDDIA
jgi:primosomal protein N' (replication factor Y)